MKDTLKLWEEIKIGLYDIVISGTVIEELIRCAQLKQDVMFCFGK